MSRELSLSGRSWVNALLARPYTLAIVVLCAILVVPLSLRRQSDLVNVFIPAAQRLAHGDDVFQQGFVYPPVNAWILLPLANLPPLAARTLWLAVNGAALMVLVWGAWTLSGGVRLEGGPPAERREHLIFGLGLLVALYYLLDALTSQQSDLIVAALVMLGCQALVRRREVGAGVLFGLAAGLKCTPLLWAGYLVWRKKWAGAVVVVAVAIGVNLLPDLTHPSTLSRTRLEEWGRRYLVPMADSGHDLGTWASAINCNHSLSGLTNRLLTWRYIWSDGRMVGLGRSERVDPVTLKATALGAMMLCVLAALICSWRGRSKDSASPSPEVLEFSLVLILMLLLSPQSSKPHFCTLFLPAFCLARAALVGRSRLLLGLVLASVTCGLVSNKDLVGGRVYDWVIWHGSITLSALLLQAGCCLVLFRSRRAARSEDARNSDLRSGLHQAA